MRSDMEQIIMELITNSGDAKSKSMEAIQYAKKYDFEEAEKKMEEANENLIKAHKQQTELIQDEIRGSEVSISLLMIHAQDHLMNAITVKDLAKEVIDLYKRLVNTN